MITYLRQKFCHRKYKFYGPIIKTRNPFISVRLKNGREVIMLVDTGSSDNHLFEQVYEENKELFTSTGKFNTIRSISEQVQKAEIVQGCFYLGDRGYKTDFQLAPKEAGQNLSQFVGFQIGGIIGSSFMLACGWVIDYNKQEIRAKI